MTHRFSGRAVIVTGGASGIGAATAWRIADEGGSVVIADRDAEAGMALASQLGPTSFYVPTDVADPAEWAALGKAAETRLGSVHGLVNCAGIAGWGNVESTDVETWQRTMAVNATGTFLGCQLAVKLMRRSGGGSIVNVGSAMSVKADPNQFAYCASKAAMLQVTRSTAIYCGQERLGIRCNAVLPGAVITPLFEQAQSMFESREEMDALMAQAHPIGRAGTAEEVAAAICFLLSDEASFITAAAYAVDGGLIEA